ncbi:MAG: PCYCGC domain-containing protein [Acidobacteria bacterium]|nr:PCYCGC domain-containing protein [Acidobacteriota bacterium]
MRTLFFSTTCFLFSAVLFFQACSQQKISSTAENHAGTGHTPQPSGASRSRRIPAYFKEPPDIRSLPPTLSPDLFGGRVRNAYRVAKEIPQTLAQMPCFCECDLGHGHKSLLSCYEDNHSVGCPICQDSALLAGELKKEGLSDSLVRDKLIARYIGN